MVVRHIAHNSIDKQKWDQRITEAENGLIYALSWYLDVVAPSWEALVIGDYDYLFPLPVKHKYKLPYLVQPMLSQQLGVFSKEPVTADIIRMFINKLPSYSYELHLNEANVLPEAEEMPNYVLPLQPTIDQILKGCSKNTLRNIDKARKMQLVINEELSIADFLSFFDSVCKSYHCPDLTLLERLIRKGKELSMLQLAGVYDEENLVAALCYTEFRNRITYLLPLSNELGKKECAMFYLVSRLIHKEAGRGKVLDFEGSRFEGIARFYKGFGAKNQPYYKIKKLRPSFLVGRI